METPGEPANEGRVDLAAVTGPEGECLGSREEVAALAARLGRGLSELAGDVHGFIVAAVPALSGDQPTSSLLERSVEQNIEQMLDILARGSDPVEVAAPSAALEHARRLAQRGVSTFVLIRAYRMAQRRFLRRVIEDLVRNGGRDGKEGEATLHVVDRITTYIDHVQEQLIVAYAKAREEWLKPNAILGARVRSVLTEKTISLDTAQARLGSYQLRQNHLALELWLRSGTPETEFDTLRAAAAAIAKVIACDACPLFVPVDESSACVWLPLGSRIAFDRAHVAEALAAAPDVFASIGEPATGLTGFRRTHQQALKAAVVARANSVPREQLTPYIEIAPIAALCSDLDSARAWVAETLGPLAIDDERRAGLREAARVFFAGGSSYTTMAERLHLHRNTAQYRIRRAEEMRGRPFAEARLDVELALLACHWLGRAVLHPADRPACANVTPLTRR
jgi:PucR C-terminal helix-turn-helix domain/GGDEF-like domain